MRSRSTPAPTEKLTPSADARRSRASSGLSRRRRPAACRCERRVDVVRAPSPTDAVDLDGLPPQVPWSRRGTRRSARPASASLQHLDRAVAAAEEKRVRPPEIACSVAIALAASSGCAQRDRDRGAELRASSSPPRASRGDVRVGEQPVRLADGEAAQPAPRTPARSGDAGSERASRPSSRTQRPRTHSFVRRLNSSYSGSSCGVSPAVRLTISPGSRRTLIARSKCSAWASVRPPPARARRLTRSAWPPEPRRSAPGGRRPRRPERRRAAGAPVANAALARRPAG